MALGIHQRTHQPSHSHNDDAATVPPTPASPHGIVPETQQFPTSVDGAACPFSSLLPCEFAHQPHTQLQRWVEHVNGHAGPQGVGDDLWFDFVHEALTRRQLLSSVSFCPCGRFVPNTEYGKLRHGRVCKVMFRDLSDVRGSSLPEEFRSLSVRAFGATMDNGRIACGRFALSIIDHGAKAGRHRNACFYLACTGGDHSQALALKSSLVLRANGLARERGRVIDYGGPCTMAEDEVILSFARDVRPVVVLSEQLADSGTLHGLLYASSASPTGPITFVYYRNLHYCELQPTQPVTMEDLLNSVTLVDSMGARADSKHARARGRPPAPPRDNMQAPARPQQPTRLPAAFPAGLVMTFDGGARGNPGLASGEWHLGYCCRRFAASDRRHAP